MLLWFSLDIFKYIYFCIFTYCCFDILWLRKMKREKKKKQKYWIFIKLEVGIYRSVCVWINRFEVLFRYFFFLFVCVFYTILLVIVIDFFDSIWVFFYVCRLNRLELSMYQNKKKHGNLTQQQKYNNNKNMNRT